MQLARSIERKAFVFWLRTGRRLRMEAVADLAQKFNTNHDPANGRFASGSGGSSGHHAGRSASAATAGRLASRYYVGKTADGVGVIKPTSGGYFDRAGRYVPEVFPPDPYRLTDPANALAHYVRGSGEDRNYYLNSVDISSVKLTDFPHIAKALDVGEPGTYEFSGTAIAKFDSGRPFNNHKLSAAATVGRLGMQADGVLTIHNDGHYQFDGVLGVDREVYAFPSEQGRSQIADASTWAGRQFNGKKYRVHIVGTQPLRQNGYVRKKQ